MGSAQFPSSQRDAQGTHSEISVSLRCGAQLSGNAVGNCFLVSGFGMCAHSPTRVLGEALGFGFCFLVLGSLLARPPLLRGTRWDLGFEIWDVPVLGSVCSRRFLFLGFDFWFLVLGSVNELISPTLLRVRRRK